jgi:hypothetical protein
LRILGYHTHVSSIRRKIPHFSHRASHPEIRGKIIAMSDSWTIQMGDGSKPVRIGKFEDNVSLASAAAPVRMWEELEPLIEDDPVHEEERRPQDFRKNRRRHTFKRKSASVCLCFGGRKRE